MATKNLLERARREGWRSQPRKGRGGGHEWLLLSMPRETRAAIVAAGAQDVVNLPAPTVSAALAGAGPLGQAGETGRQLPARALPEEIEVPEWSWDRARARYMLWAKWREHTGRARKKGLKIREATAQFLALVEAGLVLSPGVIELTGKVALPTLYLWDKKLKEAGGEVEALADRRGGWLSGRPKGAGQIGEAAERAFLAVYLRRSQPTRSFAYSCMAAWLESQGLHVPSYSSVCRFVERFDSVHHDLTVWMREGEKAYSDKVGKYLSRDCRLLNVGDVLVADGHRLNFLVINLDTGKPCRMTLIGWQDWASRMFVGFELMADENSQAISSSFFNSVLHLGKLPGSVYLDNGKAFKNKYFDGDPSLNLEEFNGLYARLGVAVSHSLPYVARSKIIERWWRDFDQQCAVALPSYTGRDVAHKPAHLRRGEYWAREQQAKEEWIPTVEDVKRIIVAYAKWKALRPHPKRPHTTPWEVFQAGRGPGFAPEEKARLGHQFLHRRCVHPKRCRFTMHNVEFEAEELHGLNMKLTACYSYSDLSEIYLYDGEHPVCTARPVASYHPMAALYGDELDLRRVREAQKDQARLKADTRRLATALAGSGMDHAAEVMAALPFNLSREERRKALTLRAGGQAVASFEASGALEAGGADAPLEVELTAEELEELREVEARIRREVDIAPAYETPFFASERDKYEYLFDISEVEGKVLLAEHEAFMRDYEKGPAYVASAERYEKLRAMLAEQRKKAAI